MNHTLIYRICIVFISGIFIKYGLCATRADAIALRTDLFVNKSYDAKVKPSDNLTNPIDVYLDLHLLSINELSEVTETMKVTAYLDIYWIDTFLMWNSSQYGGLDYYLWPQVFESTCNLDIVYFPFDVQECKLEFVAWSYTKDEMNLTSGDKGIAMHEFEENSEWTVLDTDYKVEIEKEDSSVIFTIKLKRKPLYHLLSIIMPIIMLAVLNIFVFMLPSESGEKASCAMTVFLSFAVFLTIFATSVPKNSDVVPLFAIYVIILTLQSTIITLLTLVSLRCSSFDEQVDPVPRWLRAFLRIVGCRLFRETRNVKRRRNIEPELVLKEFASDQYITRKHEKSEPTDVTTSNDYTWKEVVNLFDRIGFVLFSILLVTETAVFFALTAQNK